MLQVLRREIIKSGESNIQQPVNLKRLLWNAQRVFDKEQGEGKTQSSKQLDNTSATVVIYAWRVLSSVLLPILEHSQHCQLQTEEQV